MSRQTNVADALNAVVRAAHAFAQDDAAGCLEDAASPSLQAWLEGLRQLDNLGARQALVYLLHHPSPWARLLAAVGLLESTPDRAVRSLEELHASETGPLESHALRALERWRRGELHVW